MKEESSHAAYRDRHLPTEERVDDLLGRMTLAEKISQMCLLMPEEVPEGEFQSNPPGGVYFIWGPELHRIQRAARQSRLGIPILFGVDATKGMAFWPKGTVFPSQLALACSWNPELVTKIGVVTAQELKLAGARWTFSPVCDLARDLRWGRVDETFGEDPHLVATLASALVQGYHGGKTLGSDTILSCAKHFVAYSEPRGGRDANESVVSPRALRADFLPPFRAALDAGCGAVMSAYHAIDGLPCTINRRLLVDVLRAEWGFDGLVTTDLSNMRHLYKTQKVCEDAVSAAAAAVNAGNDFIMSAVEFREAAAQAVASGQLAEDLITQSCRRILATKFELGLFDEVDDESKCDTVPTVEANRELSFHAACEAVVLLKNDGNLLPLDRTTGRIAVVGPCADDPMSQLGDWSLDCNEEKPAFHPRSHIATVLDGLKAQCTGDVVFCAGCGISDDDRSKFEEARQLAASADVVIAVLGDDLTLYGESRDRATLGLPGVQQQLLEAVVSSGTPTVLALTCSKPLTIPWAVDHVPAILQGWNGGIEGGSAIASVLLGAHNPAGKLAVSWPRHVGQLPVYYNQPPGAHADAYTDLSAQPQYAFGYGLSYTSFRCDNLQVSTRELRPGASIEVSVELQNVGTRDGTETLQLYICDLVGSVTTPAKRLVGFLRAQLKAGEKKTLKMVLHHSDLALIDANLNRVVEAGEFELMVGSSSRDADLLRSTITAVG